MKSSRIPLARNRRLFTPIARSSYKWEREYANRTAVERVNSRVDVSSNRETRKTGWFYRKMITTPPMLK